MYNNKRLSVEQIADVMKKDMSEIRIMIAASNLTKQVCVPTSK